ncbi:hypothetical protein V8E55_011863 [Tylopilus felleus]
MSSIPDAPIPLELVEDDFTEEEHQEMDLEISQTSEMTSSNAPFVLFYIVQRQLGDRATKITLEDCSRLLQEHPALWKSLLDGSYKLVRRWKVLRKVSPSEPHDKTPPMSPRITSDAARLAWVQEYRGNYPTIMLKSINARPRSSAHANCISLIQSSGYGKSRLMDEMAKLVFTIPLNIRNPEERNKGAYPPADSDVWEYLCKTHIKDVSGADDLVALFLSKLFDEVDSEVSRAFSWSQVVLPEKEFAECWRQYLLGEVPRRNNVTLRSQLYKKVIQASREASRQTLNSEELKKQLRHNISNLLATLEKFCTYSSPDKKGKSRVKIMLYFDEAHELAKDIGEGKNLYDAVWSILAEFRNGCVFTVFLSTQSSMRLLAPSRETARSSRQNKTIALWGPITETPFDCHPDLPLLPGKYGLADVAMLKFMTMFGRPLFWTMLDKNEVKETEELLEDMMKLAREKLLCSNDIDARPSIHSHMARIAILDVLITIDYEPRRVSTHQFEMELIASHMRTAFSAPDHRLYVRSGYPSEPFIAEAANRQLHHYMMVDSSFSMINDLRDKLDEGLIDLGQTGEVVMRFLLRMAYTNAIIHEQEDTPNFSSGCGFVTFLKALFADAVHSSVLNRGPHNVAKSSLYDAFKNAVVRFTHFVKAADGAAMTTRGMTMGFLRGAAIIGHNRQESIDIAIPILLDRNAKIEEASMSAFLIQVKRRHHRGSVNAYLIDAEKLGFFPHDATQNAIPYVTLIAELAAEPPAKWHGNVNGSGNPVRGSTRRAKPHHPRYSIRAYECTHETWNVVRANECDYYKHILSLDDLLADHPRQDEATLQLVRRMLPFWYWDPVWFADEAPILGDEDSELEQTDGDERMETD